MSRILKVEINDDITITEYNIKGRFILKYLGKFDSKRQAVLTIKENFKVKEIDPYTFEILESEE